MVVFGINGVEPSAFAKTGSVVRPTDKYQTTTLISNSFNVHVSKHGMYNLRIARKYPKCLNY
jgi:hypothetical protein